MNWYNINYTQEVPGLVGYRTCGNLIVEAKNEKHAFALFQNEMMLYGPTHFRSFRINSIEFRLSPYDAAYTWSYGAAVSSEMNFTYEANVAGDPSNPYAYYYNATTANIAANSVYNTIDTGNYHADYAGTSFTLDSLTGNLEVDMSRLENVVSSYNIMGSR